MTRLLRATTMLVVAPVLLLGATGTTTQTLSAQINAIGKVSVPASGSLTMPATADFSPAGGPSIAGGQLTYTCSAATLGAACSGTQTASTSSQASVVTMGASLCTGGGGSCSSVNPNTLQSNTADGRRCLGLQIVREKRLEGSEPKSLPESGFWTGRRRTSP